MAIIVFFILVLYKTFIDRIVREKDVQSRAEIQHQKQLVLENTKVQEEERKRIAVSVHDDIGNRLNILSLWLNNLDIEDESTSEVISNQISELIDSTRSISHSLYPVNLEKLGLILYIEELITNLSARINISLHVSSKYAQRDLFVEVQIYRIIQEFTTNVIKHSTAEKIDIIIKDFQNFTGIVIFDNGQGFDYEKVKKGMGIKNIESRMKSMDAKFKWKSILNKGSRLIFKIQKK
ncbi:sensor histidine kinase [Chryseobacterium luquanense]|uniref:histidine kinase n=1 Tax=Chryseobacterium luquanense TaxID=2983766 RepID=A0ABT3Y0P8_9FLAO|nr:ATP-binding protein [Chryseobacterium luquanense]MCX8531681.1 histidine kinase [Chryseobacterium luquanense]